MHRRHTSNIPTDFLGKVESVNISNNRLIAPQLSWRGDELSTHYGDWDELSENDPLDPAKTFVLVEYASGSDYSGSIVDRSNYKALLDMIEAQEAHFDQPMEQGKDYLEYTGGHGTFALAIRVDAMEEELVEAIMSLSDYPLLDESLHSEMEHEAQEESWRDWACGDFKSELEKQVWCKLEADMPVDDWGDYWAQVDWVKDGDWRDTLDDSTVGRWAYDAMELANVYWMNEQGDSMHLDVEEMAKAIFERIPAEQTWREWARKKQPELERDVMAHVQRGWSRAWWGMFGFEEGRNAVVEVQAQ